MITELDELRQALLDSAAKIASLDRAQAGWVVYLLESLDNLVGTDKMREILAGVQDAITIRLETGAW